jgi:hypothetical protein
MADDIRPFSNGTQYADWYENNCRSCTKRAPDDGTNVTCEIELALIEAYLDTGRIPLPIADRMGRSDGRYTWPCMEHDPPFINVRPDGTVDKSVPRPEARP